MATPTLPQLIRLGLAERAPRGHAAGFPLGLPEVHFRLDGLCELIAPVVYITRDGEQVRVPNGRRTDLESRPTVLPGLLNGILGPDRETAPAAVIHDELCLRNPRGYPRARADAIYWEVLRWLAARDPDAGRWERARRRVGATVAWIGLRAYCWARWLP